MRIRLRRFWIAPATAGLALLLSSCFTLQGFTILGSSIEPGGKTFARFQLRPGSTSAQRNFQFVLIGLPNATELTVGKATWGTNGTFGGPRAMSVEPELADALIDDGLCGSNGLSFNDVTGVTWKGFMTQNKVRTRGLVDQKANTDVVIRAKASAGTGDEGIFGVTGAWIDVNGDGLFDTGDVYNCAGIASVGVFVRA